MDHTENKAILESFSKFVIDANLIEAINLREILSDEVISMYIINSVKQLFEQYDNEKKWVDNKLEDAFEIESFSEIIDAYLIGFRDLNQPHIIEWLTQLKKSLDLLKRTNEFTNQKEGATATENKCEQQQEPSTKATKIVKYEPDVLALSEIFPKLRLKEILHLQESKQKLREINR